ncbi:membrane protein [Corynebacterium phage PSonyx]|nr:membrane protein [Corynebacterium phage PSonyx]
MIEFIIGGAAFIMILALVVAYDHFIEKPKWLRHQQQLHELTNFQTRKDAPQWQAKHPSQL